MNTHGLVPKSLLPIARQAKNRLIPAPLLGGWGTRGYAAPAPPPVKWGVLHRYGRATDTWIETGTLYGDTTNFLARSAKHVYSIEPEPSLARLATKRFRHHQNVTIVEGLSENHIQDVLDSVDSPLSLWLDGHYSSGVTFKGPDDTPIRHELEAIAKHLDRLEAVTILVDDFRCFSLSDEASAAYPTRSWLVQWADKCQLAWTVEHDIFVASRYLATFSS